MFLHNLERYARPAPGRERHTAADASTRRPSIRARARRRVAGCRKLIVDRQALADCVNRAWEEVGVEIPRALVRFFTSK